MPRSGSIPSHIVDVLRSKKDGATLAELRLAVERRCGHTVLQHSLRSAVYAHLDDKGERLFTRTGTRGKYRLQS